MVLEIAVVSEPLGADFALDDEAALGPAVPRLELDDVDGLKHLHLLVAAGRIRIIENENFFFIATRPYASHK